MEPTDPIATSMNAAAATTMVRSVPVVPDSTAVASEALGERGVRKNHGKAGIESPGLLQTSSPVVKARESHRHGALVVKAVARAMIARLGLGVAKCHQGVAKGVANLATGRTVVAAADMMMVTAVMEPDEAVAAAVSGFTQAEAEPEVQGRSGASPAEETTGPLGSV